MNDFKITLWMHTIMTKDEVSAIIGDAIPQASYMVEDLGGTPQRLPKKYGLSPGMDKVEVRDGLL